MTTCRKCSEPVSWIPCGHCVGGYVQSDGSAELCDKCNATGGAYLCPRDAYHKKELELERKFYEHIKAHYLEVWAFTYPDQDSAEEITFHVRVSGGGYHAQHIVTDRQLRLANHDYVKAIAHRLVTVWAKAKYIIDKDDQAV